VKAIAAAEQGEPGAEEVAAALLESTTEKAWLIDEEMMKVFVNSERWSLGEANYSRVATSCADIHRLG
jgi:hypothetical protein